MPKLAEQLIAENKQNRSPFLDLGKCGLNNALPEALFDCAEWLTGLNLGYYYFDADENNYIYSKNNGKENIFDQKGLEALQRLTHLQSLHLSDNKISDISPLTELSNLQQLHLSGNQISDISPLTELTKLQRLNLSGNQISDISPLTELTKLQQLYLSRNKISDISPLTKLPNLQQLDLSFNQISDYSPLNKLTNLQQLHLRGNKISDISPLTKLPNLQQLDLSFNQISDYSPLNKLTNLQQLHLSFNQISDYSPLNKLTNLQQLDLSGNKISDISPLTELPNLQELYLSGNKISDISPLTELPNLQELYLSGNQISDISPLTELTKLQRLNLSGNQISDISPLTKLPNLQQLDLSGNKISDYSPLTELTNLQELNLSGNQISDYSPLTELPNLQQLDLSFNQISDISFLAELTNLQELDLSYNQISDISPLTELTNLQELDLSGNQISDISPLTELPNLQKLHLSRNQISDLGIIKDLLYLESLKTLYLSNNPLPIPIAIDKNNLHEMRAYVSDLAKAPSDKHFVKLLFLGDGCVGKSTLYQHLETGKPPKFIPVNERTHGIQTAIWANEHPNTQVYVWDFGGQEIFHSTHRLFLGQQAIYILMWTLQANKQCSQNEQHPLRYWLEFIADYGADSRVLLVENTINGQFDSQTFPDEKSFSNLIAEFTDRNIDIDTTHHRFDCQKGNTQVGRFKDILKSEIETCIAKQQAIPFPQNWMAVIADLEQKKETQQTLSKQDYSQICTQHDISDTNALLSYLDRAGFVCYLGNFAANTIVLQTQWLLDAMYEPLNNTLNNPLKNTKGKLTDANFTQIWNNYDAEHRSLFKQYLLFSELLAEPPRSDSQAARPYSYLMPNLFPDRPPRHHAFQWEQVPSYWVLQFRFWYPAIMQRLQVHILNECHGEEEESLYKNELAFTGTQNQVCHISVYEAEKEMRIYTDTDAYYLHLMGILNRIYPLDRVRVCEKKQQGEACEIELEAYEQGKFRIKPAATKPPKNLVMLYAPDDEDIATQLCKHLSTAQKSGKITIWHKQKIEPGAHIDQTTQEKLAQADIILLLVSVDFIDNKNIWENEWTQVVKRHEAGKAVVVPILCRPCNSNAMPYARLKALPDEKTISQYEGAQREEVLKHIAAEIEKLSS